MFSEKRLLLSFFFTKLKTFKKHFFKFLSFVNLPCGQAMSHKKMGPIGSAVLMFIGYKKQTDTQTVDRQPKFIYRLNNIIKDLIKLGIT